MFFNIFIDLCLSVFLFFITLIVLLVLSLNDLLELWLSHELWIKHLQPWKRLEELSTGLMSVSLSKWERNWSAHFRFLSLNFWCLDRNSLLHWLWNEWLSFVNKFCIIYWSFLLFFFLFLSSWSILLGLMLLVGFILSLLFRNFLKFSLWWILIVLLSRFICNRAEFFGEMQLSQVYIFSIELFTIFVSEWSRAFKWFLLELFNSLIILFGQSSKFSRQVQHEAWKNLSSSIHLAMSINVTTMQELIIKHDNQLWISFTNDDSSGSEWNVLSHSRVQVHNSVSNSEVLDSTLIALWTSPVWELFLIDGSKVQLLSLFDIEINRAIISLNIVGMVSQLVNHVLI